MIITENTSLSKIWLLSIKQSILIHRCDITDFGQVHPVFLVITGISLKLFLMPSVVNIHRPVYRYNPHCLSVQTMKTMNLCKVVAKHRSGQGFKAISKAWSVSGAQ